MEMSERIKERRRSMGYTQEELADKLGLQKSAIAKYENGRVENIKRSIIQKMALVLECSPAYLMGWIDTENNPDALIDYYYNSLESFEKEGRQAGYIISTTASGSYLIRDSENHFLCIAEEDEIVREIENIRLRGGYVFADAIIANLIITHNINISSIERTLIMRYRAADSGTQRAVRKLLDVADDYLMPIAAHAHDDATAEDLTSDIAMLREAAKEKK